MVYKYAPPTYADEIGLTSDKYLVVNSTVDALPLSLNFQPLSFARWQLIARMEEGLKAQQEDFGFSENDIDEVRRLIADTKTWLLAVTMLASVLHLLFEFLAFKSDVDFWKNNKSMKGLSFRSYVLAQNIEKKAAMYEQERASAAAQIARLGRGPAAGTQKARGQE